MLMNTQTKRSQINLKRNFDKINNVANQVKHANEMFNMAIKFVKENWKIIKSTTGTKDESSAINYSNMRVSSLLTF